MRFKKAFTLAELMVVLAVIGVLAGVLIPVANNARPDENVMKFKKANATLGNVIRELVNSDKYYAEGDLGKKANGDLVDGTHTGDKSYFLQTFADVISTKEVVYNEESTENTENSGFLQTEYANCTPQGIRSNLDYNKNLADTRCKELSPKIKQKITSSDKVVFYEGNPRYTFGMIWKNSDGAWGEGGCEEYHHGSNICDNRLFWGYHKDCYGLDRIYKLFCIDVDGIPNGGSANCDDKKDVCPFGYGIRADGKIIAGARADEWLEKGFQKGKNDN